MHGVVAACELGASSTVQARERTKSRKMHSACRNVAVWRRRTTFGIVLTLHNARCTMHVAPWMRRRVRCMMHAWQDEDEKAHLREQLEILSMTLEGKQRREEAVSAQPTLQQRL